MSDNVSMSLDDIISKNKSSFSLRRGRGGRGRGRARGVSRGGVNSNRGGGFNNNRGTSRGRGAARRGAGRSRGSFGGGRGARGSFAGRNGSPRRASLNSSQWNHDMYYGSGNPSNFAAKSPALGRTKLVISNLYFGVSDSDIKELFAEFGTIKMSAVHYDKSGRSLGTAHVIFERRSDAMKAMNHYHNVDLDNRPMKISIEDERGASSPAIVVKSPLRGGRGGNLKRLQKGPRLISNGSSTPRGNRRGVTGRGRGRVGRGRGRGRGGRGGVQKKPPTTEELDAELEAYSVQASK